MTNCVKTAEWSLYEEEDRYQETFSCTEHLSEMVADGTTHIYSYKGNQVCCYTGVSYKTIDGKWWEFEDGEAKREVSDDEATKLQMIEDGA